MYKHVHNSILNNKIYIFKHTRIHTILFLLGIILSNTVLIPSIKNAHFVKIWPRKYSVTAPFYFLQLFANMPLNHTLESATKLFV